MGPLYPQAVDVQTQSLALRGPDGEPQPGLESQGRAASMPRLAAGTQVGGLGVRMMEVRWGGMRRPGLESPQLCSCLDTTNPVGHPQKAVLVSRAPYLAVAHEACILDPAFPPSLPSPLLPYKMPWCLPPPTTLSLCVFEPTLPALGVAWLVFLWILEATPLQPLLLVGPLLAEQEALAGAGRRVSWAEPLS